MSMLDKDTVRHDLDMGRHTRRILRTYPSWQHYVAEAKRQARRFGADARHFWQFAGPREHAALHLLTEEEHRFLLGEWSEEDWGQEI